jgi:hypothetical protein
MLENSIMKNPPVSFVKHPLLVSSLILVMIILGIVLSQLTSSVVWAADRISVIPRGNDFTLVQYEAKGDETGVSSGVTNTSVYGILYRAYIVPSLVGDNSPCLSAAPYFAVSEYFNGQVVSEPITTFTYSEEQPAPQAFTIYPNYYIPVACQLNIAVTDNTCSLQSVAGKTTLYLLIGPPLGNGFGFPG